MKEQKATFTVIDPNTGMRPDIKEITKHEEWAKGIYWADAESHHFAVTENGELLLVGEVGFVSIYNIPQDRFKVTVDGQDRNKCHHVVIDGVEYAPITNDERGNKKKASKTYTRLADKRFGRLVVIGEGSKQGYVKVKCDCGVEKEVMASCLKDGSTRSCGCLHREIASRQMRGGIEGEVGVTLHKPSGKWLARIMIHGKVYNLGSYVHKSDAVKARKDAERELLGRKDEQRESCENCKYNITVKNYSGTKFKVCIKGDREHRDPHDEKCNGYERK